MRYPSGTGATDAHAPRRERAPGRLAALLLVATAWSAGCAGSHASGVPSWRSFQTLEAAVTGPQRTLDALSSIVASSTRPTSPTFFAQEGLVAVRATTLLGRSEARGRVVHLVVEHAGSFSAVAEVGFSATRAEGSAYAKITRLLVGLEARNTPALAAPFALVAVESGESTPRGCVQDATARTTWYACPLEPTPRCTAVHVGDPIAYGEHDLLPTPDRERGLCEAPPPDLRAR